MKTSLIIIATVILIVVVAVVYTIKNPDKILSKIGPDVENVSFTKSDDNVNNISIVFRNKFLPVSLDSLFMEVKLDEKEVVKIAKSDTVKIESNSVDTLILPSKIDYKEIFKIIQEANKKKKDSLQLNFKGFIFYNFPIIGNTKIPMDKQFTFKTPHPPEIELERIKIERVDLPKINLLLTMKIKNNEDINLEINSMDYSFLLGDSIIVSKGSKKNSIVIEGKKSTTTNLPVETNINVIDNIIGQIIKKGGKLPFTLNSEMNVSTDFATMENLVIDIMIEDTVEIIK